MEMNEPRELFYFTDPMCSWCYGFGPELDQLLKTYPVNFSLTIVPGGLRPYEKNPMPERMAREISVHWRHVRDASGLPFHFNFFKEHPDFIYDTAPSCRAVNTVALIEPDKTFEYLKTLQSSFYGQGKDPTSMETFREVATVHGIDADQFKSEFEKEATEQETRRGFGLAAELGIMGYPTLCLRHEKRLYLIARGFLPADSLKERLDVIIQDIKESQLTMVEPDSQKGETGKKEVQTTNAAGEVCEIGPDGEPVC